MSSGIACTARMTVQASRAQASRLHLSPSAPAHSTRQRAARRISAVAAPVREELDQNMPSAGSLEQELRQQVAAARTTGRIVLESKEELKSTWEHRAWVAGGTLLMAGTLAEGLSSLSGTTDALQAGATVFAAYVLADLGTAFYHFGVDNYGDGSTPVFGGQIAAFQGHHQRPWTITEREFCNNLHKLFRPATFFAAGLFVASLAGAPALWDVWSSTFLFLCCMSQQFHAWSHMKKSELPAAVVALQDAGVLISRRAHGAHHKSPFNCNYSIVSGWWNPLLDGSSPETSFWMWLERAIYDKTGVEPRSWHEPGEEWQEQQRPEAAL